MEKPKTVQEVEHLYRELLAERGEEEGESIIKYLFTACGPSLFNLWMGVWEIPESKGNNENN